MKLGHLLQIAVVHEHESACCSGYTDRTYWFENFAVSLITDAETPDDLVELMFMQRQKTKDSAFVGKLGEKSWILDRHNPEQLRQALEAAHNAKKYGGTREVPYCTGRNLEGSMKASVHHIRMEFNIRSGKYRVLLCHDTNVFAVRIFPAKAACIAFAHALAASMLLKERVVRLHPVIIRRARWSAYPYLRQQPEYTIKPVTNVAWE